MIWMLDWQVAFSFWTWVRGARNMAQLTRSHRLYHRAEAALISAIEIYNKPDFKYREETFAILALNAWELMLKARLLAENANDLKALYVYESRSTKTGAISKKRYLKRNRASNPHTLGLGQVIVALEAAGRVIAPQVKANVEALQEIRDNAIHFFNTNPLLAKQVLEIGTATLHNFVELAKRWFDEDLSHYSLFLMPIGFLTVPFAVAVIAASDEEQNLIKYLDSLVRSTDSGSSELQVAIAINLSFKRGGNISPLEVSVTRDPTATKVVLAEEDIRKTWPWDYYELTRRLRERYKDFKENKKYHNVRKTLAKEDRFMRSRFLDPGNPKSARKDFFSPNILSEFDAYYVRRAKK
jgi:hypothetical protein